MHSEDSATLEGFVDQENQAIDHIEIPFSNGMFWFSQHNAIRKNKKTATLPKGFYMGCGIANGSSTFSNGQSFHFTQSNTALFNIVSEPVQCSTTVNKGRSFSCGFFLPESAIESCFDSRELLTFFPSDNDVFIASEVPVNIISRLLTPISDALEGHAKLLMAESRALEFFAVMRHINDCSEKKRFYSVNDKRLYQLTCEYIEIHYYSKITLKEVANSIGTSVRRMTDVFRKFSGMSVIDYLTEQRMILAKKMLEDGARVKEVAYKVGYKPTSFSTAFTKRFGISPSHYITRSQWYIPDKKHQAHTIQTAPLLSAGSDRFKQCVRCNLPSDKR